MAYGFPLRGAVGPTEPSDDTRILTEAFGMRYEAVLVFLSVQKKL